MKNLITIFTTLFFICMTYANDFIYTYTIKYDNTQDVLIKIKIPEDLEALGNLLEVATINVTGDCTDKSGEAALLKGAFFMDLKSNEPAFVTLNSYTFLGVYGKKKWNNYAITRSSFRLQGVVMTGSEEGKDFCCSDKLGNHLYASMNGPNSESDLNSWTTGIYSLFGPWDNFNTSGYAPAMPTNANRGYFVKVDKEKDCAPALPKSKEIEEFLGIFDSKNEVIDEESKENSPSSTLSILQEIEVSLFPNPTSEFLNINISNLNTEQQLSVSIYNSMGQLIDIIFDNRINSKNIELKWNDKSLVDGTYFVLINQNGKIIQAKPFMYKQ